MESWQYILVFFAVLMIARIVPRMLRQRKMSMQQNQGTSDQGWFKESKDQPFVKESPVKPFVQEAKPEPNDMKVLGNIIRGYKTFGDIRKQTGLSPEELDSILADLEKRKLMRVEQKKGLVGIKVELFPTEKGYREYDA